MKELCQVREFNKEADYSKVSAWWQEHGWSPVPVQFLPKLGIVSFNSRHDCAAAWLYMDNSGSGICMLEWMVTNPEIPARDALLGIKAVTEFITSAAKEMGYTFMFTTCKQESLAKVHEKHGFQRTDSGMIHFYKSLQEGI